MKPKYIQVDCKEIESAKEKLDLRQAEAVLKYKPDIIILEYPNNNETPNSPFNKYKALDKPKEMIAERVKEFPSDVIKENPWVRADTIMWRNVASLWAQGHQILIYPVDAPSELTKEWLDVWRGAYPCIKKNWVWWVQIYLRERLMANNIKWILANYKVQKQLKDNYELTSRNVINKYLLSGKIYCSCGRRRTGEGPQHGKHLYYRCSDRVYTHPLPPNCHQKGINARIADKLVWDGVKNYMTSPDILKAQVRRWMEEQNTKVIQADKSIEDLRSELTKIKKEEQRYIRAYGAEMIDSEQLQESTLDLKKKRKSIEQQISSMTTDKIISNTSYPNDSEIDKFCNAAQEVLGDISFEAKQAIIRKVVDTIVGTQLDIKVYGHMSLNSSIIANICGKDIQDVKFETSSRNSLCQTRLFPFELVIQLPPPRLARNITERDKMGRIVSTKVENPFSCHTRYQA